MKIVDLTGKRFGRLHVVEKDSTRENGKIKWLCKCDCGKTTSIRGTSLSNGTNRSCGCLQSEVRRTAHTKHGNNTKQYGPTAEYRAWRHMMSRCRNKNEPAFIWYGKRGIQVSDRWNDFSIFLQDMGKRPSTKHSIDRIDCNGNYEPGNCRWATMKEQQRNRRNNRILTVDRITASLVEHCERLGVRYATVHARLKAGMSEEVALQVGRIKRKPHALTIEALNP
jgi:hypothetical protein